MLWKQSPNTMMKLVVSVLVIALSATSLSSAIPKPADGDKNRVFDKELSDEDHFKGQDHNSEYDHEAFLGKEEAKHFDELTPEESKERLGLIFEKIDKNKDGDVTEEELRDWIKFVQNRYIMEDTERQWKDHEEKDGALKWESYKKRTYGLEEDEEEGEDEDAGYSYKDMIKRDKRRWKKADKDEDGLLNQEEFSHFLHPEEAEHMKEIVVEETLEDIDKDNDGKISLDEYIADMWPNSDDEEEPDWVKTEREQFTSFRDKNTDGFMDQEEVSDWILPSDYDHSEAEARHLIHESDTDGDGKLGIEEVKQKYDLFVGSQATDFGEYLTHDEF